MFNKKRNPRQGGNPGAGTQPFGNGFLGSIEKYITPSISGAIEAFREAVVDAGGRPGLADIQPDGKIHRFPVEGKKHGRDFSACLFPDGRGGWFQDFTSGRGVINWRFQGGRRELTPAERRRLAESIRRTNERRKIEDRSRKEARRIGFLLYDLNQTLTLAEKRLAADPEDAGAWFALGIVYRWYTRTEFQHDQLLSRSELDKIAALGIVRAAA